MKTFWIIVRIFQCYMVLMASSVDIFKGRCVTILPILACIADLLATEYNG